MLKNTPSTHPTTTSMKQKGFARISPPTVVDHGNLRFLITDQPTERTFASFSSVLKEHQSVRLVRACGDNHYDVNSLRDSGIMCYDLNFDDGSPPPTEILTKWLNLVEGWFIDSNSLEYLGPDQRVAIHCVAGLGRAPVLVVIALIEDGMEPLEAVQFVRGLRRGALNTMQLRWIEGYSKTREKKWNRLKARQASQCCTVS